MALQNIPGRGAWIGNIPQGVPVPSSFASSPADAPGEKLAIIGRFFNRDHATKDITKIGFLFGTIVKAGGSGLTVSLQDVDLATGPPYRPDETQDQTVAIANGDADFASNTWYQTGALSANRTIAYGELVAVVIEYDGSGHQGSDSFTLSTIFTTAGGIFLSSGVMAKIGASPAWTVQAHIPNIILEATDGTFCTLADSFVFAAVGSLQFNSGSAQDEYCLEFELPGPVSVDGFFAYMQCSNNAANFDWVLYDGTTPMTNGTVSADANAISGTSVSRIVHFPFGGAISLAANTKYRLALKPTTVNNVSLMYFDVANANHFQAQDFGVSAVLNSRVDGGAWGTPVATRRPFIGLRICAIDDGTGGGGGGLLTNPGMAGGMRG